mmetsp:Transcript_9885/g.16284  ORF Transcript_9885/g.16284 Transcript_9885/m.16284 type:complete len:220 (-) Transcript_9885:399-1058(-)
MYVCMYVCMYVPPVSTVWRPISRHVKKACELNFGTFSRKRGSLRSPKRCNTLVVQSASRALRASRDHELRGKEARQAGHSSLDWLNIHSFIHPSIYPKTKSLQLIIRNRQSCQTSASHLFALYPSCDNNGSLALCGRVNPEQTQWSVGRSWSCVFEKKLPRSRKGAHDGRAHTLIHSFTHSLTHSLTHSVTHSFNDSLNDSFANSPSHAHTRDARGLPS